LGSRSTTSKRLIRHGARSSELDAFPHSSRFISVLLSQRYTIDVENDLDQANRDAQTNWLKDSKSEMQTPAAPLTEKVQTPKHSWADFRRHFGQWKHGKVLFGTAWSWFALDVAFYGLGLNSSIILQAIGFGKYSGSANKSENIFHTLHNVAVGNLVLAVGGLIPGYYFSFFFIDSWGRKKIQVSVMARICLADGS
jgi:PHS family inorganic phosphate transporter-like MFS transporter